VPPAAHEAVGGLLGLGLPSGARAATQGWLREGRHVRGFGRAAHRAWAKHHSVDSWGPA
jgi:hypothetical protein